MRRSILEKGLASALLATAVVLVILGMGRYHEVWEKPDESPAQVEINGAPLQLPPGDANPFIPPDFLPPPKKKETVTDISDLRLVIEATRSGVLREESKLYFTGAQQCST